VCVYVAHEVSIKERFEIREKVTTVTLSGFFSTDPAANFDTSRPLPVTPFLCDGDVGGEDGDDDVKLAPQKR